MFDNSRKTLKEFFSMGPSLPKSFKEKDREDFIRDSNKRSSLAMKKAVITAVVMISAALYINSSAGKSVSVDTIVILIICGAWVAFTHYRTFKD